MEIEYDDEKNCANIAKHGVAFERVSECDWSEVLIKQDTRFDYKEVRYSALVPLNDRLHNVVFTKRNDKVRVISFRKANQREKRYYEQER